MAIDLQRQNGLINRPPTRRVLTGCLQLWKLILFKIKRFGGETAKGECADVDSVKDVAVRRCCCCQDQDLCYCCCCQLERLSMKGGLLRKSCASVCVCADVSVDLCVYGVFPSVCVREVAGLISNCFSCRHGRKAGGQTCCSPSPPPHIPLSVSPRLPQFSPFMPLSLLLFLSLCFCFPPSLPPPPTTRCRFWEE